MRFMIIVKATQDSEAGVMPEDKLIAAMATYHEELAKAGVLLHERRFGSHRLRGIKGPLDQS